jgi:hypothetical protein
LEALLLTRFRHCKLIGVNLSMAVPLEQWDPFDLLLERDSARRTRPDIVFLSRQTSVPVVGVCLVEPHEGALDQIANAAIARLTSSREMAVVNIDTRLDQNSAGLRNPSEVEALIARMDVLITTRLHGTVLALKNGVPVIAIDPISGGAKIRRQAEAIRWPVVFTADALKDEELLQALRYCLSDAARERARRCAATAAATVETIRDAFIAALGMPHELPRSSQPRAGVKGRADWPAALTRDGAGDGASSECGRRRFKYRIETLLKRLTRYDA